MSSPGSRTDVDARSNTSGTVSSAARHGSQPQPPPETEAHVESSTVKHSSQPRPPPEVEAHVESSTVKHSSQPRPPPEIEAHVESSTVKHESRPHPPPETEAHVESSTVKHESQPHPPPKTEALVTSSAGGHEFQPQSRLNTRTHTSVDSPAIERGSPPETDHEGRFKSRFVPKIFKRGSGNGSKPHSDANASESLGANLLKKMGLVKRVEVDDLSDQDIIIAVMGPTGTGKSSFISKVLGDEEKNGIGHSLESCTTDIKIMKFSSPEKTNLSVVFVDTPGFDDTHKTDVQILEMIANWLQETYKRNVKLSAILYFHRISDNRMAGTPLKNLRMFEQLCGKNGLSKIILVTTMWDDNLGSGADEKGVEDLRQRRLQEKVAREKELKENYWKSMINQGSTVARHVNTQESALSVIKRLLDDTSTRFAVQLQEELVDMKRQLPETHAGRELYNKLEVLLKRQQDTMKKIRQETEEENNQDMLNILRQELEKLQKDIDTTLKEMQTLKIPLPRLVRLWISSLRLSKLWNLK